MLFDLRLTSFETEQKKISPWAKQLRLTPRKNGPFTVVMS